ncbi:A/G-specific adenine glycosylase [uncultured Fibrobacter sp.]|uniref:A/G-specific adenine glycosylase n=1 Tax=uncultured Fibrobacter sp. TaxID=261512 RepID=UPI00260FA2A6|nr:A/G-specific adenine glycosylase [uncultured Fibrobacter sp.]
MSIVKKMDKQSLKNLRDWFKKNAAELPWRPVDLDALRDPYAVWISETMLQQTQVATVREYFIRWMRRFPDIESLAKANEEEVFKYWQGLGYYSRARNILKTAKQLVSDCHDPCKGSRNDKRGERKAALPSTRKELEALPGIGAYTAGAILSLAYHQQEAILDGNLVRIFSRLYALDFLPTDSKDSLKTYWDYAREVADSPKAYMHNEALMELGRTVCKVKNPDCTSCPLQATCKAFAENRTAIFPPTKKHVQKDWHGTVLVIESSDHRILAIRGSQKFFKKQWTLPHFESSRNATAGLPAQAEAYINADHVSVVKSIGFFKHNITVHKIECDVLHIQTNKKASVKTASTNTACETQWVKRDYVQDFFANSFCLKALALLS